MAKCFHCGEEISGYPFVCKLCDEAHCGKHRIPEIHDCININVYRSSSYRKTQQAKNREMRLVKKSGSYTPASNPQSSGFGSNYFSDSSLRFRSMFFGDQEIKFLGNNSLATFYGGLLFGLAILVPFLVSGLVTLDSTGLLFTAVILLGSGLGFSLLNLIRKQFAHHYSMQTAFGIWPLGIVITLITSLFRFTVYAFGFFHDRGGDSRSRAMLGIVGISSSFGLWVIGYYLLPLMAAATSGFYTDLIMILSFTFRRFLWWGLINLLPFGFLDGKKVYDYNVSYFIILLILAFIGILIDGRF